MLGGGGSQGGNGAFSCSSSPALPPARRHHQLHQPTSTAACWNVLGTSNGTNPFHSLSSGSVVVPSVAASEEGAALVGVSHLYGPSVQRKRPGCLCDHYNDNEEDEEDGSLSTTTDVGRYQVNDLRSAGDCMIQPLDLSLPKVKVRQHWSGGSIVQVNDSTIISINSGGAGGGSSSSSSTECCRCPSSSASRPSPSRLNVSVVTVPPQTSCWPGNSHFAASSLPADRQQHYPGQQHHHHPQQRQQPFRLQIEIPLEADKLSGFFRQPSSHRRKTSHSSSGSGGCATSTPLPPAQVPTANNNISNQQRPPEVAGPVPAIVMKDDEDDLQRLSDSAHQLRLSGYYYGHLSWKESMQLLQDTKIGTFLIRDSSDARYLYALSLQTDKGPTSVRIHYSSHGFRLDANSGMADHLPRFRTVLDLVDYYVAKWAQCRDKGQFWLDNSGQVHSEVVLVRPLLKDCPSLKHLCRLAWNRRWKPTMSANQLSSVAIPTTVQTYLNEYPNLR